MKKTEKKTEIATNVSSGAEKVEVIKEQVRKTQKPNDQKIEREEQAAQKRVKTALKEKNEKQQQAKDKAEKRKKQQAEKQKRAEERKALQAKRIAERKALQEKRAQERKALQEKRQAMLEEKRRERAHAKANRRQEQARAKARREEKRKENRAKHNRDGRQNNSGWIAAVAVLGATTLGLATALTLGSVEMNKMQTGMHENYRSNAYELMEIIEHVDDDLDRVRIANTPEQQSRILTDLLVQMRLAELDFEKLPVSTQQEANITTFINRTAKACEGMLAKLRSGESLDENDKQMLQRFYQINGQIKQEIDGLTQNMDDETIKEFVKKGKGKMQDMLQKLDEMTMTENGKLMEEIKSKMKGAGAQPNQTAPTPNADQNAKIDTAEAEELCQTYFAEYGIQQFNCVGETVTKHEQAYNVQGYTQNGTMLFAEIDYHSGQLIRFDFFEDCNEETFDHENAERIATQFLEKLGYQDMQATRLTPNGTDADFLFVYTKDDVAYYPDSVRVKVCRTRGVVTSFDAGKYLRHHKERTQPATKLTLREAKDELCDDLDVQFARLSVVQTFRGERPAYEFLCNYEDQRYLIYIDAETGAEIAILNLKNVG